MRLLCLDIGSTWTKAALVDDSGQLLGTAQHPTTLPEADDGLRALAATLDAEDAEVLACSSAGGGLRLAVVGQERLISAEAGNRVALSAGAKVVHIASGELDGSAIAELRDARPDVVLLTGGTDGGDRAVLLHNASELAVNELDAPIVLAGNESVRDAACARLREGGHAVYPCANVLPDIGLLAPDAARRVIREVFLRHVIGGNGVSARAGFHRVVRTVTPDAMRTGVARLAGSLGSEPSPPVLAVDVGGATTDVYSTVSGADDQQERSVALPDDRRTVEGDIGVRFSAGGLVHAARTEGLLAESERQFLREAAELRVSRVDDVFADDGADMRLAELATVLAARRHIRLIGSGLGPRGAGVVVLSGGVFRHATARGLDRVRETLRADPVLRPHVRAARIVVDSTYVLAPAGLLADSGRFAAADRLAQLSTRECGRN